MNFLEFSSVKVGIIWQTFDKYFILFVARFSGTSKTKKDTILQKSRGPPVQIQLFSCLKFVFRRIGCTMKILENFNRRKLKKITNKAM